MRNKTVKISKLVAALALVLSAGFAPAFAADDPLQQAVDSSLIVTRVGGVGTAMVVGTPVAILRQTHKSYVHMTTAAADKIGGHDCGPCCLLASVVTIPASLVVGPATGTYYGAKNAFSKGFSNPFSPASFSLADDFAGE
jgi:hypothetical protein